MAQTTSATATPPPKRYSSDRWHRLNHLLKGGRDSYVAERREQGLSWHRIAADIARDIARHPEVTQPTVGTLIRWYAGDKQPAAA
jgi:hypothetical protein